MLAWLRTGSRWIPLSFVAFFVVVVAVDLSLVTIAVTTSPGLAENGAYAKGLAFNRALEAARASKALGWTARLELVTGADGEEDLLHLHLVDRDGAAVTGATARVMLVRPTSAGSDLAVTLTERGDGSYETRLRFPLPGQWRLEADILRGADHMQAARRVVIPL